MPYYWRADCMGCTLKRWFDCCKLGAQRLRPGRRRKKVLKEVINLFHPMWTLHAKGPWAKGGGLAVNTSYMHSMHSINMIIRQDDEMSFDTARGYFFFFERKSLVHENFHLKKYSSLFFVCSFKIYDNIPSYTRLRNQLNIRREAQIFSSQLVGSLVGKSVKNSQTSPPGQYIVVYSEKH